MAKRTKRTNGNESEGKTRPDIVMGRADESSYIAKIQRPNLAIRGTGLTMKRLTKFSGVNEVRPCPKKAK